MHDKIIHNPKILRTLRPFSDAHSTPCMVYLTPGGWYQTTFRTTGLHDLWNLDASFTLCLSTLSTMWHSNSSESARLVISDYMSFL